MRWAVYLRRRSVLGITNSRWLGNEFTIASEASA